MKTPKEQITELMMGKTIEEIERNNTIVEQALLIERLERELAEVTKQRNTLAEALREIASRAYSRKTCVDVIAPKALEATKGGGA